MIVNLKKITQQKERLEYAERIFRESPVAKGLTKPIKELTRLLEEIATDLEIGGECILELDKPRLEAIKERDKFLQFLNQADEP